MSCDVGQSLPVCDSIDGGVESLVHSELRAVPVGTPRRRRTRRSFTPRRKYEFDVFSDLPGNPNIRLKAYSLGLGSR